MLGKSFSSRDVKNQFLKDYSRTQVDLDFSESIELIGYE